MKKKFTFLIAALMLLMMFTIPMRALADSYNYNFSTGGTHNSGADPNTNTWVTDYFTILQEKGSSTTAPANYLTAPRWYQNNTVTFTPKNNVTITQIVINCSGSNNGQDITASTGSVSKSGNNSTWTGSITSSTPLVLTMGKQCRPTSLNVTYTTSGGGSSAVATTTEITVPDGFNKDLKNGTTAGTLTATVTETESGDAVDGATVNWLSNNTSVATVNASGEVTLFAEGTVKITATYEGVEDEYEDSHDDYTFTVVDSRYSHSNLIFTAACGGSGTADDGAEWTVTSDADESNFIEGSGIHYGTGSKPVQYIQLETSDIEGQISKVVVNTRDSQSAATVSVTVGGTSFSCSGSTTATNTPTDYTFTGIGSGDIVVRIARSSAINGAIYVNSVKVTYQEVAVKDPVITVPDSFIGSTTATITCGTAGATIKYNYDGGSIWNAYSTGLNITETTTIYAKATKGEDESSVVSKTTTKTYNVDIDDDLTNGIITANLNVAAESTEITLTITPDDCYQLKSGTLVVLDDEFNEISVTNNKFYMPGSDVLVSAEFELIKYTVQYSVNGVVGELEDDVVNCGEDAHLYDADDLEDAGVSLPAGCSFVGWSANPASTAVVSSFYPDADATLYAVLSQSSGSSNYVKVTEDLTDWSGEYLIVYEDEDDDLAFDGSLTVLDAVGNTQSVTITDGTIASTTTIDGYRFTIAAVTNGYSIQSASGYYIGQTSDANGIATSDETVYTNTITYDSENETTLISSSNAVLRYNSASNQTRFRYYKSSTYTAQNAIQLYKKQTSTNYTRIEDITTTTATLPSIEPTYLITVVDGGVLTLTGNNNGTAANLIIEDGGQLITHNAVQATLQKGITGYGDNIAVTTGWYTIASPVVGTDMSSYATGTYDLFKYDEANHLWKNIKNNGSEFTSTSVAEGFLYANGANQTLPFAGEMKASNAEVTKALTCSSTDKLIGFNLVGNPFTCNLTSSMVKMNGETLSTYYVSEGNANLKVRILSSTPIKPGQGFFVQAPSACNLVFNETPAGKGEMDYKPTFISIEAGNTEFTDNAYIQLGYGNTLRKMSINDNTPLVYVMNEGADYAAATVDELKGSMPVCFKAAATGQYTISVNTEGLDMSYLHLIDRFTGEDVNLLLEPTYSFIATKGDNESRFILSFTANCFNDSESETFAYQAGNDIFVSGEGELQIFDVTGRMVSTTYVNGIETIKLPSSGMYIFRLVGTEVKTQKIVVR